MIYSSNPLIIFFLCSVTVYVKTTTVRRLSKEILLFLVRTRTGANFDNFFIYDMCTESVSKVQDGSSLVGGGEVGTVFKSNCG